MEPVFTQQHLLIDMVMMIEGNLWIESQTLILLKQLFLQCHALLNMLNLWK